MGCDIHVRAEYRLSLPDLTDTSEVEAWLVDESAGSRGGGAWTFAEPLSPNKYYTSDGQKGPELDVAYDDRFYTGQNYALFSRLSDVRNDSGDDRIEPLFADRDFPGDACDHVREEYEGWGLDAHTPGWATLADLLAQDWSRPPGAAWDYYADWRETIERLKTLAAGKCGGDPAAVRLVWWYDN